MQKFNLLGILFVSCLNLMGMVGQPASAATLFGTVDSVSVTGTSLDSVTIAGETSSSGNLASLAPSSLTTSGTRTIVSDGAALPSTNANVHGLTADFDLITGLQFLGTGGNDVQRLFLSSSLTTRNGVDVVILEIGASPSDRTPYRISALDEAGAVIASTTADFTPPASNPSLLSVGPFDFNDVDTFGLTPSYGSRIDVGARSLVGISIDFDPGLVITGIQIEWLSIIDAMEATEVFAVADATVGLSCTGFEPPMEGGAVRVKKNRSLPHKAQLMDGNSQPINDLDITAPPVIQVLFDDGVLPAEDVSDDALSAGAGTEGNQFEFLDSKWQFNLKTRNYTGAGTYTTTMVSGDETEYLIDPTCEATFVIR